MAPRFFGFSAGLPVSSARAFAALRTIFTSSMLGRNSPSSSRPTDLQVKVLPAGFEYEGHVYKSLSAVAKVITGQHCNGYHFFRLRKEDA